MITNLNNSDTSVLTVKQLRENLQGKLHFSTPVEIEIKKGQTPRVQPGASLPVTEQPTVTALTEAAVPQSEAPAGVIPPAPPFDPSKLKPLNWKTAQQKEVSPSNEASSAPKKSSVPHTAIQDSLHSELTSVLAKKFSPKVQEQPGEDSEKASDFHRYLYNTIKLKNNGNKLDKIKELKPTQATLGGTDKASPKYRKAQITYRRNIKY